MNKAAPKLAERIALLKQRCGSWRAVGRLLGASDISVKRWAQGFTPLDSTLREAARHSGLSYGWLRDGTGDQDRELAKARPVSVEEGLAHRIAEDEPGMTKAVEYIARHGEPGDVAMVEEILKAALKRICERQAESEPPRGRVQYPLR